MEQLIGEKINVLPFRDIKKISDLIFFEGPVLSHFRDIYGKDVLFYWVDSDDNEFRWLVFQVSEEQLYKYLSKNLSLRQLIDSPINDIYYTLEVGNPFEYRNIVQIFKGDLNPEYIPSELSFFELEIPKLYHKRLDELKESFLKEYFLENAFYAKASPSREIGLKNSGLVDVEESAYFLNAYGASYRKLVEYKVRKEFYKRDIYDEKRVKKAISKMNQNSLLNLVSAKAASFAIALCPNNISIANETFLNKEWRDNIFQNFKTDVVDIDKKTEDEVDGIIKVYGEDNTSDIYKPIIDLYNDKKIEISITDKNFKPTRTIKPIDGKITSKLIPKPKINDEPVNRFAAVKVNPSTGRIIQASTATLFDQSIQPSWSTNEIRAENKTYKLRFRFSAEYRIERSLHSLELDVLDIYATGDSLTEAEIDFYNQFDALYHSLTIKPDTELSSEERERKRYMQLYIK